MKVLGFYMMCVLSVCVKSLQSCLTLQPYALQPIRLLCAWDFLGKNTRVGCHALLQEIFLTQGSNPHLMSYALTGRFFLPLCHQGSPFIMTTKKITSEVTMEHTSHNYRLDVAYELPAHRPGLCRKPSPLKKKNQKQ